jgi:hypothetical protein
MNVHITRLLAVVTRKEKWWQRRKEAKDARRYRKDFSCPRTI